MIFAMILTRLVEFLYSRSSVLYVRLSVSCSPPIGSPIVQLPRDIEADMFGQGELRIMKSAGNPDKGRGMALTMIL